MIENGSLSRLILDVDAVSNDILGVSGNPKSKSSIILVSSLITPISYGCSNENNYEFYSTWSGNYKRLILIFWSEQKPA